MKTKNAFFLTFFLLCIVTFSYGEVPEDFRQLVVSNRKFALFQAVSQQNAELFRYLIESQENPKKYITESIQNYSRTSDENILLVAEVESDYFSDFLQVLLDNGMNINEQDKNGRTLAFHLTRVMNIYDGQQKLEMMIPFGADFNIQDIYGNTVLHFLLHRMHLGIGEYRACEMLLQNGADPDIQDNEGNTPLHVASQKEQVYMEKDVVALLLKNGANPAIKNKEGKKAYPGNIIYYGKIYAAALTRAIVTPIVGIGIFFGRLILGI